MLQLTTDWFTHVIPSWEKHVLPIVSQGSDHGLEIGSYEGRSAIWTLQNLLAKSGRQLYCLDLWEDSEVERRFDENLTSSRLDFRVEKLKGSSVESIQSLPEDVSFDWIYIDGSHEARDCLTDAVLCFSRLNIGGVLVFDDYEWRSLGRVDLPPKPAIDCFLKLWRSEIEVLNIGYQVILRKTRKRQSQATNAT